MTRKEAIAAKLKWYSTGKPCKNGHLSRRLTINGDCCECQAIRQNIRQNAERAAIRAGLKDINYPKQEKEKFKELDRLVKKNADLFRYLWGIGDGRGGHIFGTIRQAVTGDFFEKTKNGQKYVANKNS